MNTIPGVWEAYEGLKSWEPSLKACVVSGSSVCFSPLKKAEFSSAPPSIKEALEALEKRHKENFQNLLQGKLQASPSGSSEPAPSTVDPRLAAENEPVNDAAEELPSFANEAAVKEKYNITVESKMFGSAQARILVSDGGHAFLVPKDSHSDSFLKS